MQKLGSIRNDQELKTLRTIGASQAFANFTWSTTPFLVSCSTFAVFVATQDRPLTTDIVFPALTLFNLLTFPLTILPMVITSIVEASVAVNRLTEFFSAEELQRDAVVAKQTADKPGDESVSVRNASFTWDKFDNKNVLEDIDFTARKGQLSCIVGRVGSGKSSLLSAMLGDLFKTKGEVVFRGASAYVSQSPWIQNATVKENITFGHRWDPQFYDQTVKACALLEDFSVLPDGDETEVGERGISLSGGQKSRLTLARAVYARADVYLLDDCLSAVDQHVGRHLIDEVFGVNGLLKTKTRILATNSIPVLHEADHIVLLRGGRVAEEGSFDDLMRSQGGEVANLVRTAQDEKTEEKEIETSSSSSDSSSTLAGAQPLPKEEEEALDPEEMEETQEGLSDLAPISAPPRGSTANRKASSMTLRRASTVSFHGIRGKATDEETAAGNKTKQTKEASEQGKVKWDVYGEYAKNSNIYAVAVYLLMLVLAQTAQIGMW